MNKHIPIEQFVSSTTRMAAPGGRSQVSKHQPINMAAKNKPVQNTMVLYIIALALVSCSQVMLDEPLTATNDQESAYPVVQHIVDNKLDDAMSRVSMTAARSSNTDPRLSILEKALTGARAGSMSSVRAMDPDMGDMLTDEEDAEIDALMEDNPMLASDLSGLAEETEAEFADIAPVTIEVQPLDENDNESAEPYTVTSDSGIIDTGDEVLSVEELLLQAQAEEVDAERGFAAGSNFNRRSMKYWKNGKVYYYFGNNLSASEKNWMRQAMARISDGTGMSFKEGKNNGWRRFWHSIGLSKYLKIFKVPVDGNDFAGRATLGKCGKSVLEMRADYVTSEQVFDHEMGHVFGILHEHQRYDRGAHVTVEGNDKTNLNKISRRNRYSFLWWSWTKSNATTYNTPFDYNSIMIYTNGAVTINSTGLIPEKHFNNIRWGDMNGDTWYTPWDIYTIKKLYSKSPNTTPEYTPSAEPWNNFIFRSDNAQAAASEDDIPSAISIAH